MKVIKCIEIEKFKVKIIKANKKNWYHKLIGQIIEVYVFRVEAGMFSFPGLFNYSDKYYVSISNVEIIDKIIYSEKIVEITV